MAQSGGVPGVRKLLGADPGNPAQRLDYCHSNAGQVLEVRKDGDPGRTREADRATRPPRVLRAPPPRNAGSVRPRRGFYLSGIPGGEGRASMSRTMGLAAIILLAATVAPAEEWPAWRGPRGVGRYSALLIVAEIGEAGRFRNARQVGAYAGLTARVRQSGQTEHRGGISKQGSRWLRWILVQAAMKLVRKDERLANFYTRVRKRAGRNVARVAAARKLAGICWVRLRAWQRAHAAA